MKSNRIKLTVTAIAISLVAMLNSCQPKTEAEPTVDPNSYAYQVVRSAYVGAADQNLGSITFNKINSDSGTYVSTASFMGSGKYYKDKAFTEITFVPVNASLAMYPVLRLNVIQADANDKDGVKFRGNNVNGSGEQIIFKQ